VPLLEILALAVGSMFWPLLLVVVVLALNTRHPVKILSWFWAGGMLASVSVGAAIVYTLEGTAARSGRMPSAPWVDVVVGALALVAAAALRRYGARTARRRAERTTPTKQRRSSERVERLVERGGPLAFVGGIVASIFPAPLAIIAMADIAQLDYSTAETMVVILVFYLVMFTFVEAPIVGFVIAPDWTRTRATRFNGWLGRNLVQLGVWALTILGVAEIVRGVVTALL
jgi:Sap, sulfolipid-1-addressing protein